jgi:hypothetical protein
MIKYNIYFQMKYQLVVPGSTIDVSEELYKLWDVQECTECGRFYFVRNKEKTCSICEKKSDYFVVDCDKTGKFISRPAIKVRKCKNKHTTDSNREIRTTYDYETLFKETKIYVTKTYPDFQWNIGYNKFNKLIEACYLCGDDLMEDLKLKRTKCHIITDKTKFPILRFACHVCHRMKANDTYEILFRKCESICNTLHRTKNTLFHSNVFSDGTCHFKYEELKRIKTNNGYVVNITEKEYLTLVCGECYYCSRPSNDSNINDVVTINRCYGYVIDNCVTCCTNCKILRTRMKNKQFEDHISNIYHNAEFTPRDIKNQMIINNHILRLYTYSHNDTGVATNIIFNNMYIGANWSLTYIGIGEGKGDNIFFKMEDKNNINAITSTETFQITNGMHKLSYIGLSQSNNRSMTIKHTTGDNTDNPEEIINNLRIDKNVLQKNSDIYFRVPYSQNLISVTISNKNNKIVGISFAFGQKYMQCNCNDCTEHNKTKKCLCNTCIKHMMHGQNSNCSCMPSNNKVSAHTNLKIIGTPEQIERYTQTQYLLKEKNYDVRKAIIYNKIDRVNGVAQKQHELKVIEKIGKEKFDQKKCANMKKSICKKIDELGIDEYREQKNEYMKKYRKEQAEKNDRSSKPIKKDEKTRKKNQRERIFEERGKDICRKINNLERKISRAKKAKKSDNEINKLRQELKILKQK